MSRSEVIAAIAAGLTGAVTIFLYLSISLPLFFHTPPMLLYTWDASNALGYTAASQASPAVVIAVGQSMHVLVSLVWGFVFVLCSGYVPQIRERPVLYGIAFGLIVMLVMRFAVVPLGHAPRIALAPLSLLNNIVAHTLFFGLPVALVAVRVLRQAQDDRLTQQ